MKILPPLVVLLAAAPLCAQGLIPALETSASSFASGGGSFGYLLTGVPGRAFAVLADPVPGPIVVLGVEFGLGLSPGLFSLGSGSLPANGESRAAFTLPPSATSLAGLVLYTQAVEVDAGAPNGLFRVSNRESTAFRTTLAAIVDRFDAPAADGFTGSFDRGSAGALAGGAVLRRTHRTVDLRQGATFGQGIASPLQPLGARAQLVYRPRDLGATGEEEIVTAIRWRAFGGVLVADTFPQLEMRLSHSDVVPDYRVDPFSALPSFPNSGLDPAFAQNVAAGDVPVTVYSGPYALQPNALRADGYVDYPAPQTAFGYDGTRSLLIEFRVPPSSAAGVNGQLGRLMVLSDSRPGARNVADSRLGGGPVDPNTVTTGLPDNFMYDYQIEFTRTKTVALSPWRAGAPGADYRAPIVVTTTPPGTSVAIEYRGANDVLGANATAWSSSVDVADGRAFVQYRIALIGDAASRAVPSVDTLVIPY